VLARLRALASESVVYGLSGIISRFLTIFLVPIYTRLFTPEDYGVLSLVGSTLAIVSILVVLGLDNSAHRWFWDTEDEADRRRTIASWAWCQLAVATVVGAGVFVAAEALGRSIVGRADAALYFRLVGASLPLTVLGTVASNWLRMQRRPWATTGFALGTSVLTIVVTLALVVWARWGLTGVYAAQLVAYAAASVAAAFLLRSWLDPRRIDLARLRGMLRFALPLIPAGIAYWVVGFADRFFVQVYSTTAEVGLYSIGSALASGVALVTGAFQQAWGPFAFSIHKADDARATYANVFLAYLWGASLLSVGLSLFAPEIIHLLATDRYARASTVVGVLAMSYVMIGLTYIAATGPSIVKRTGPTGIALTAAAVLNLAFNFLLVPRFGMLGSAVATLIAQTVTPAYLFYRSQALYPIPYRFGAGVGIVAAALTTIAIGAQLDLASPWAGAAVKLALLALFLPLPFVLGVVTPAQARGVVSRLRARGVRAAA
jgi:O-antigen/teichoic acid export membrane protein